MSGSPLDALSERLNRVGVVRNMLSIERKMDRQAKEMRRHTAELKTLRENLDSTASTWLELELQRLRHIVPVDQPLALVSQVQRSGGTLMSQLFDGHPQCHAHPGELHVGYPSAKRDWPQLDLSAGPAEWYAKLRERLPERAFLGGYTKYIREQLPDEEELETFPMLIPPAMVRFLFQELAREAEITSQRDVLNAYMTAFFNGWLDNQNLYAEGKRWVTAFAARTTMVPGNVEKIFADYPDGKIMSVIREPVGWYASAAKYRPETYGEVDAASALWRECADAMAAQKREHPDRVHLIDFRRLLSETEDVMREVAAFLDIEFLPILTEPTFNGMPIRADSSFAVPQHGVLQGPLNRRKELDPDVRSRLEDLSPLYDDVVALAG